MRHKTVTESPETMAGIKRIAKTVSSVKKRATARRKIEKGGWSTYPAARCRLHAR
jgi:hypothetical protein